MKVVPFFSVLAALVALPTLAQVRVQAGGADVNIGGDGSVSVQAGGSRGKGAAAIGGNTVGNAVGSIGDDVESQGVTIINGRVYIDGKEIPPKVTRYKSPRTGEVYIIRRKGTSVEVTSEQEGN